MSHRNCLAFAMALALAACGGGGGSPSSGGSTSGSSTSGGGTSASGPAVSITATPPAVTKDAFAQVSFGASGAARFSCSLDGAAAQDCTSPHLVFPLDVGAHRLTVTAFDASGNAGTPATAQWTVSSIFGDAADRSLHPELIATTQQPAPVEPNSWRGIMRINCDFSHSSYDDPIVFPGRAGAAHLHRFYGNLLLDENSTIESLFTSGNSSCQGNTLNRSSYWIPALIAPSYEPGTSTRLTDSTGAPAFKVVPAVVGNDDVAHEIFYYSAGVSDLSSIQPIPLGMKMIAGNHMGQPGQEQDTSIVRWHCQSWESSDANNPRWSTSIPACAAPDRLRMDIFFPSCWNGTDLDSSDHKSHLAYPVSSGNQTVCPSSHPVPIIRVSYHYAWGVLPEYYDPTTRSSAGWRLASDSYATGGANAGGMSLHGDWFNAWHPEALQAILDNCIKGALDCHDGNLATGVRFSGTRPGTQGEAEVVNMGHGT